MTDFLTNLLHTMPSAEEWLLFLMTNGLAYVAARNTVLRRARRQQEKFLAQERREIEVERALYTDSYRQKEKLADEYWEMIKKQSDQIYDLTAQLHCAQQIHLN